MEHISVRLFNSPSVSKGDTKIVFPSRKVEALFYYMVVNKEASREEVSGLLWPDAESEAGRKNIRNAIYYIKKSLNLDIIVSPRKSTIMMNPDIHIDSDLEMLQSRDKWMDAYTGEFLQGFVIKEEEALEEWITSSREKYKSLYVQKLYKRIKESLSTDDYGSVEQCARRLIEIDQYDEKAHRVLMKVSADMGLYNKAADIYNRLSEVLKRDLGIIPDIKSRMLFQKIQDVRNSRIVETTNRGSKLFYGRQQELSILHSCCDISKPEGECRSVVIVGEAGIGKTALKDRFLEDIAKDGAFILESSCYQAEEGFPLKPWNGILARMLDIAEKQRIELPQAWKDILAAFFPAFASSGERPGFTAVDKASPLKLKALEETAISLINKVSGIRRTIIVFDDIQWMDNFSITLLSGVLLRGGAGVTVIATCRNSFPQRIDNFTAEMVKYNKIYKIELNRFTREEVFDFVRTALPQYSLAYDEYEKIYKETEGNTFFIVEYLNSLRENRGLDMMSSRMADILKSRFIGIGEKGLKLLNIASVFFSEIPVGILAEISGMDKLELLDALDDLKARFIIKETDNKSAPGIIFTHQKLREFIYNQQSVARKQIIHGRIGEILESSLMNDDRDITLYSRLIYHFSNSGNIIAALKYSIKNANFYLDFSHELFPVLYRNTDMDGLGTHLGEIDSLKYLDDIEGQLARVKEALPMSDEIAKLEIAFLHMKGRYLIRQGEYSKGVALIHEMIDSSRRLGETDYILKGYRQLINYGIQTRDLEIMKEHIEAGLAMARKNNLNADIGMFLRLNGLHKIMNREYEKAEELLKECINRFLSIRDSQDRYSMNVAAAYSYIGDIRRYNMRFQSSLEYYDKAISLSEKRRVNSSQAIFCTNAGQAAFDAGDYIRAKSYFAQALKIYGQMDSIWGRGIAEGYTALLLIKEGDYKEALESLKRADEYSDRIKNPYEIGLICRIKAEIRSNMESNKKLSGAFERYLCKDTASYCEEGIKLLKEVNDKYQIDIINVFANRKAGK
ncbi:MAG: AAA family ATPase [Caulobacteraceae bacterium]